MDLNVLSQLGQIIEAEEAEAKNFTHKKFKKNFLDQVYKKPKRFIGDIYEEDPENKGEPQKDPATGEGRRPVSYDQNQVITCCPEPITFLSAFNDYIENQEKCRKLMRHLVENDQANFRRLKLDHEPAEKIWFNSTKQGINLRPGLLDGDGGLPAAVTMGDLKVHGLVVGRTGAGKSVFLNNLIFNMLMEYAPWELDLYLADFKKVELSRYLTQYPTPHLKTCAATSEIRYVITMLSHLVDCMYARQTLFARLGIQKLSEFRDRYQVVLPRVLLLVDEFQQMFQEATAREAVQIEDLLLSITKLGRATGFHLLFASQEMNGALSGKAMANFKIRFALPCDAAVSADILGNSAAATLERGNVLVNAGSGAREENQLYKVPFISDDSDNDGTDNMQQSYFYGFLQGLCEEARRFSYDKPRTFYQEDAQSELEELEQVLEQVKEHKGHILAENPRYVDIITLGHSVVYSDRKYDLETFFIERGRNKNLFAICPDVDDLAYIQQMLAVNLAYSSEYRRQTCVYYDFNPILSAKYRIANTLPDIDCYDTAEALEAINKTYQRRVILMEAAKQPSLEAFLEDYTEKSAKAFGHAQSFNAAKELSLQLFRGLPLSGLGVRCRQLCEEDERYAVATEPVEIYFQSRFEKKPWEQIFPILIYWISGIEYLESVPKWMLQVLRAGSTVNQLFFLFSASEDTMRLEDLLARCDYLFVSGNYEKIYHKCGLKYTHKSRNSIVIDFKIKSLNTERSFKKYKIKSVRYEVPFLDFDALMS